jgi:hypothetical protein
MRNCATVKLAGIADALTGVTKVQWSTRRSGSGTCDGAASWKTGTINISGGEDTVTITASDAAGNIATDTLTVKVISLSPGSTWTGRAMVSVPVIPDQPDPKLAVGFEGTFWAMFDPPTNSYVSYPGTKTWFDPAEMTPGRGFWARFSGTAKTPYGTVPPQDRESIIHLYEGWNIIGTPFITPVEWNATAIQVAVGGSQRSLRDAADAVAEFAWGWDSAKGDYYMVCDRSIIPDAVGSITPWQAYWIKAETECDLILPAQQ